jgi:hypothetical protein
METTSPKTPYENNSAPVMRLTLNVVSATSPCPASAALEGRAQYSFLDPLYPLRSPRVSPRAVLSPQSQDLKV